MKNKELFNKTISILVKAYQKDTLQHGDCTACAVGNLICHNMFNGDYDKWDNHFLSSEYHWSDVFCTDRGLQKINAHQFRGNAIDQVVSTGYEVLELAKIERAFESVIDHEADDRMFNGLMAVVDALMLIHEADNSEIEEAKLLFVK